MRNSFHWKLTGNWQKDSLTNKAVCKIHIESGRKIREAIVGLGPVTLEEASEKGNITHVEWVEIFPGEWVVWPKYWTLQPWGLTKGRQTSLPGWRTSGNNKKAVESLALLNMHVCLIPKQDKEDVLKLNQMLTSLLQSPRYMPQLELVNAPAPLQCHTARCKGVAVRHRSNWDPKQHLSRAEAAFFFFFFPWYLYMQCIRNSEGHWPRLPDYPDYWITIACSPTRAECPQGPSCSSAAPL